MGDLVALIAEEALDHSIAVTRVGGRFETVRSGSVGVRVSLQAGKQSGDSLLYRSGRGGVVDAQLLGDVIDGNGLQQGIEIGHGYSFVGAPWTAFGPRSRGEFMLPN